ncbi:hypothetical protein NWU98_004456 [Vibrio vulnificus]|nr:hypothetical protein [Vibrio vulnificus]ELC9581321.1 hypothetical protein [Vibrio vulnificus]ELV8662357.1 hypothetical protein [Vibrio vulnificus]
MFLNLVSSDFSRLYEKLSLISLVSSLLNPSFHACFLIRCAQCSPRYLFWLFRNLLIWKHSIDFGRGCLIERGLLLPHPIGIVFGGGSVLSSNCTIYQNVTIGKHRGGYPIIGFGCIVYGGSYIVGDITIGKNCIVGALKFVSKDVEDNVIIR